MSSSASPTAYVYRSPLKIHHCTIENETQQKKTEHIIIVDSRKEIQAAAVAEYDRC